MKFNNFEKPTLNNKSTETNIPSQENGEFFDLEKNIGNLKKELSSIDEEKLSPEQKSKIQKIKEKIFNKKKKFIRITEAVVLISGVFAVVNHERAHSDLIENKNEKGEIVYSHEDQRTTHLLNILAGKEKFDNSDLMFQVRPIMEAICNKNNLSLPKNIDQMSLTEIDKFIFDNQDALNSQDDDAPEMKLGDIEKELTEDLENMNGRITDTTENKPNKDLYNLVWTLEKECGNPRIRFYEENIGFTPFPGFEGSEHYNPLKNIIYISKYSLVPAKYGSIVDEMSHAKQFNNDQVKTYLNVCSNFLSIFKKAGFNSNKISGEYNKLYSRPGTFEYEAHQVIEPYLKNKYKFFTHRTTNK